MISAFHLQTLRIVYPFPVQSAAHPSLSPCLSDAQKLGLARKFLGFKELLLFALPCL